MGEPEPDMGHAHAQRYALPLHIRRLERAFALPRFLNYAESVLNDPSSDEDGNGDFAPSRDERRSIRSRLFNAEQVGSEREGVRNALLSDSSEESVDEAGEMTEWSFQSMLKQHVQEKKWRKKYYSKPSNCKYQYYGSGLLSNYDKYLENQEPGPAMGYDPDLELVSVIKAKRGRRPLKRENSFNDSMDGGDRDSDEGDGDEELNRRPGRGRPRRKNEKKPSAEAMAARRRKIFAMIAKKEVGKTQRARANTHKEVVQTLKKVAQMCTKHWKQNAVQSQKNMKETVWRNKRLAREMQTYWKRYERVERDARRKLEKEAEEQRRMDLEFMEAKRQQRKLNFLITQTELYAHFISKKFGSTGGIDKDTILKQLEDEVAPRLAALDNYNSQEMKIKAESIVTNAVNAENARTRSFDVSMNVPDVVRDVLERSQPAMFKGTLKHYQLKGMNWLANLYDQGINGILADEMGLGKTVQSIAFLAHVAEKYDVWGPFLVISPASTLHNWQQELQRFVPNFKVVPYWGNVHERRILRQFWDTKHLHTENASFHVVVTSYQLIVSDFKYFNRIKWQYLILDEAQAIKSSNSQRWKLLLGFSCRNRLLLSGTPIQNSMAELWALLHFIMPTLFDNHEEFSEWFSKDIEGQAENKTRIDEKHLSRLHLILKPFMLRRIKKDVENELSDKIEVMVYCPLTTRQRLLYAGLKQKIRVEDLLAGMSGRAGPGDDPSRAITSNLMNLVMQFRKVCNHPELFERREAYSPLFLNTEDFVVPKLVYEDGLLWRGIPSQRHLTHNHLSVFSVENLHRLLYGPFSFLWLLGLSAQEVHCLFFKGILAFWLSLMHERHKADLCQHNIVWDGPDPTSRRLLMSYSSVLRPPYSCRSEVLSTLVFTKMTGTGSRVYTHTRHSHHAMPETLQHRILRSQKLRASQSQEGSESGLSSPALKVSPTVEPSPRKLAKMSKQQAKPTQNVEEILQEFLVPEFPFVQRPPEVYECVPTDMPDFLYWPSLKVQSNNRRMYASCRNSTWEWLRHTWCYSPEGFNTVWYGHPVIAEQYAARQRTFHPTSEGGILAADQQSGWSNIVIPDKQTLVADAGKLYVLDGLLKRLKEGGHRVLIYSQMTRMIDLLEEYMWHRKHTYMRLDGSSKISERRDMVADFQARADIFVFLLSTRAGGLGINLTAADTVIFYDSDWNPTVDQQAMDRAHRLGQTKQVTVYRLICKGTIEERMLQRAREKSEIQRMVISGGDFKPDQLKTKEVVSLLLDDEEMQKKYQQKQAERKMLEERFEYERTVKPESPMIKVKSEPDADFQSPSSRFSNRSPDHSSQSDDFLDVETPPKFPGGFPGSSPMNPLGIGSLRVRPVVRGTKRGRPRGVGRGGSTACRKRTFVDSSSIKMPGELFIDPEFSSPKPEGPPPVKRGPGRPRMKPIGPAMQGTRGPRSRGRRRGASKATHPLVAPVPLSIASSSKSHQHE